MNCTSCIFPRQMVKAGLDARGRQRYVCPACQARKTSEWHPRGIYLPEKFEASKVMFQQGHPIRAVARLLEVNSRTARKYHRLIVADSIQCPCGKVATHQGWCEFRFQQSPARQQWLARCHAQSASTRLARVESRSPLLTTWPFVRAFDGDDYSLMKTVNNLVPRTIPELVRQDVCQDILLDVIGGKLFTEEIAGQVKEYIKRAYRFVPSKFGPMSLDDAIYSEGKETYADRLVE